jgi:DNA modification methylase
MEMLSLEMGGLDQEGFDLSLIGFNEDELANIFVEKTEGLTDPDEVPEVPDDPITKTGDVWVLGKHRLMCGDSTVETHVSALLGGVEPHLMVTDPPYGVEYDPKWRAEAGVNKNKKKMGEVKNDDRADWREAWALFPGDVAYVWHGGLHAGVVADSLIDCGFTIRSQIIWSKDRFALSRGHYHWQHEPCWYAAKGTANWGGDRKQSTVWNIKARDDSGMGHGTQKPVECMKRPIENNSSPGQAVYEPFSGSGTTIIAGEMTGRCIYAMELSPEYCDVAVERWQNFTGEQAELEGSEKGGGLFPSIKENAAQSHR